MRVGVAETESGFFEALREEFRAVNQKISLTCVEKSGDDVFKAFVIALIVDILVEP